MSNSVYVRTVEDVKKVIEHAKLVENDLRQNVQPIYFGETFENYKLMELDEHILADLKCGQTYVPTYLCLYAVISSMFKSDLQNFLYLHFFILFLMAITYY